MARRTDGKVTPELLARYLDALDAGPAPAAPAEPLPDDPAVAAELRELLAIARAIGSPPPVEPTPEFRRRGRAALLAAISARPAPSRPSLLGWLTGTWRQPFLPRLARVPALVAALTIALLVATGAGVVSAAQDALPGDSFYPVKTAVEDLRLTLAADDESRALVLLDLAATRLSEVERAGEAGRAAAVAVAADAFAREVAAADQHLERAASSGKDVGATAERLAANLERQQAALAAARDRVPDQAKASVARAAEAARKGLTTAAQRAGAEPAGRPQTGGPARAGEIEEATAAPSAPTPGAQAPGAAEAPSPGTPAAPARPGWSLGEPGQPSSGTGEPAGAGQSTGEGYRGLLAKLAAAEAALARGRGDTALRILDGFESELDALDRSGHLGSADREALLASYRSLVRAAEAGANAGARVKPYEDQRPSDGPRPESTHTPSSQRGQPGAASEPRPKGTPEHGQR